MILLPIILGLGYLVVLRMQFKKVDNSYTQWLKEPNDLEILK